MEFWLPGEDKSVPILISATDGVYTLCSELSRRLCYYYCFPSANYTFIHPLTPIHQTLSLCIKIKTILVDRQRLLIINARMVWWRIVYTFITCSIEPPPTHKYKTIIFYCYTNKSDISTIYLLCVLYGVLHTNTARQ